MNYKKGDFTKYIELTKKQVEDGEFTKEEAIWLVLQKVQDLIKNIPLENIPTYEEQFMKDQEYYSLNIN